jgi:DNA repair protein RecN (Recombination protein N)
MKKPPLFLSQLQLLNFATFENQTITFQPGFNSIVGETGSGKSLILDALQIALGGKADKKFIRTKAESAVVEVTFKFESKEIENFLITQDYPAQNNEIIIKRIIDQNGKSKSYLNFQNCTVSLISQFASMYIDVVGQFENQNF